MSLLPQALTILAVKGSFVIVLAWLVNRSVRGVSSAFRHTVWLVALASVLLLPVAALLLPERPLPLLPASDAAVQGVLDPPPGTAEVPGMSTVTDPTLRGAQATSKAWVARLEEEGPSPWILLWCLGAVAFSGRLTMGLVRLRQLRREATPLHHPDLLGILRQASMAAGFGGAVEVATHRLVESPCTWGWRHPVVLLPHRATDWSPEQLQDVMHHELAHVGRRDWLGFLLANVACALCWFHPLVWLAASRLRLEAEKACDDQVLDLGASPPDYAERLLRMARHLRQSRPRPLLSGSTDGAPGMALEMARRHQLSLRIAAILNPRLRRHSMNRTCFGIATFCALALITFIGPSKLVHAGNLMQSGDFSFGAGYGDLDSPSEQLIASAGRGHLADVNDLLQMGADANARLSGEGSPLILAARRGHREVVEALLAAGADPDLAVRGDGNPLIGAAARGDSETVQLLLGAGADVNAAVPGDGNALIMAARGGHTTLVDLLLNRGAAIDQVVRGDENALIRAAGNGHLETTQLLIDRGADVDLEVEVRLWPLGKETRSPLTMARKGGHREVVDLLLRSGATP